MRMAMEFLEQSFAGEDCRLRGLRSCILARWLDTEAVVVVGEGELGGDSLMGSWSGRACSESMEAEEGCVGLVRCTGALVLDLNGFESVASRFESSRLLVREEGKYG